MADNDNKSSLSSALSRALVKKTGEVKKFEGPKTTNIDDVKKAVNQSSATAQTLHEDDVREKRAKKGICFVIDATGSREASWDQAQRTQYDMFEAVKSVGHLEVGVVVHRGGSASTLGWFTDAATAQRKMGSVSCSRGETRIADAVSKALTANPDGFVPSAIILVGDCCEENMNNIEAAARRLKEKGVKVYAFLEGNDDGGRTAYGMIADITGGVFKQFGAGLNLDLQDLCVAAAVFDTGGMAAFDKLLAQGHKGAKALLGDVKRKQLGYNPNYPRLNG